VSNKHVSFSQYSMYKNCPHQWYLSYPKGLMVYKSTIHTIFGTAFHETVQNYLKVMFESSAKDADKIHLPTYFKTRLVELYTQTSTEGHYSTPEELTEFFEDAVAILEFFKKKRSIFFKTKNTRLIGIEIPILSPVVDEVKDVVLKGFIDLVTYDTILDKYTIYDIKTSTKGRSDYEKKDQTKINQILFYKKLFSQLRNIPEEKIDVQFFIVRRKINENLEFPPGRIQEFVPAHGTRKLNEALEDLKSFVLNVFTPEGEYQEKSYPKNPNKCRFCNFNNRPDLCDRKFS